MLYSTCAIILTAGSSFASAAISADDLADLKLWRRLAGPVKAPKASAQKATTAAQALGVTPPSAKAPSLPKPNPQKSTLPPPKTVAKPNPKANTNDADTAQIRKAAQQAAVYMTEYQKAHPPRPGQSLADDVPPPVNFQLSTYNGAVTTNANTYQGPVTTNDNRQTATGGSTISGAGSTLKIDKSMNDNRQQAGPGATINGAVTANKNSRRDTAAADSYSVKEDGRVVYRDFVLLVRAMRRDPRAKEEVLYEIAGVPGFRHLVESLIQGCTGTSTDGQLTMDNFASLVSNMTQDKTVESVVVDAFNSNLVYASLIEKLLVKYYKPQDQTALKPAKSSTKKKTMKKTSAKKSEEDEFDSEDSDSEEDQDAKARRDFNDHYLSLAMRSLYHDGYLQLDARDLLDEYDGWLAARELQEEEDIIQMLTRSLNLEKFQDPEIFY